MIQVAKMEHIGKNIGLGGQNITKRTYKSSPMLKINPNDGTELDSTQELADNFKKDGEGMNNYFNQKAESIKRDYRNDSNSAASLGVSSTELQGWLDRKNDLLDQLELQKDDAMDLASIYSEDPEEESEGGDNVGAGSGKDTTSEGGAVTGTGEASTSDHNMGSVSGEGSSTRFPQDSSDVNQTDFSSFEPFEE